MGKRKTKAQIETEEEQEWLEKKAKLEELKKRYRNDAIFRYMVENLINMNINFHREVIKDAAEYANSIAIKRGLIP